MKYKIRIYKTMENEEITLPDNALIVGTMDMHNIFIYLVCLIPMESPPTLEKEQKK